MTAIALDGGDYNGTYKLVGEEISFDFINTISWPDTEWQHDWLDKTNNFILWAVAAGIINNSKAKLFAAKPKPWLNKEMKYVHTIRQDLENVLTPLAFNKNPSDDAIKKLNLLIHQINDCRNIDFKKHTWVWIDALSFKEVLAPVIWNAGHVLTEADHIRIRHCPSCNWLFYDKTKNKSRRWCDMQDCGSRDKSLRYYHRTK